MLMTTPLLYPNVSIKERIIGPAPFTPQWRNRIGIVGTFSKGPATAINLNDRETFAYIYGEDNTPGSIAVRQAMLQNTTNFSISRIIPSSKTSQGTLALQSSSPLSQEAFVATGDERTVGLTLETSYISPAVKKDSEYLGELIRVDEASSLNFTGFTGFGAFEFETIEKIDPGTVTNSGAITLDTSVITANQSDVQIITASGTFGQLLRNTAKPGLALVVDPADSTGANFLSAGGSFLEVLTYAYESSPGTFSVLVRGQLSASSSPNVIVNVEAQNGTDPAYYVIGYDYLTRDGSPLTNNVWISQNYYPNPNKTFLWFLTVDEDDRSFTDLMVPTETMGTVSDFDTGINLAFGTLGVSNNLVMVRGSRFQIGINVAKVSIGETDVTAPNFPNTVRAFLPNTSSVQVLTELRDAIATDSVMSALIDDFEINQAVLPYSLTFNSVLSSESGNRVKYTLTRTVGAGVPTDLLFGPNGADYGVVQNMTGGADSLNAAYRVLYDLNGSPIAIVQAISPGSSGNRLRISVTPQPPGQFIMDVVDEYAIQTNSPTVAETLRLSNYSIDPQSGLYMGSLDSNLVRVFYLPIRDNPNVPILDSVLGLTPQRLAPIVSDVSDIDNPLHPSHRGSVYLSDFYLERGSEPSSYNPDIPEEQDVIDAVKRLESQDVAFILLAGITVSDSRYAGAINELILQAERSTTINGLRIALLQAPSRLKAGRAATVTRSINSTRTVVVAGHVTMPNARNSGANNLPAVGFYAGTLAVIPPQVSPAATTTGHIPIGIDNTDTQNDPNYLNAITENRMEAIYFDPGQRLYKFLNGITASIDPNERYVSVLRISMQIQTDLYRYLNWVRSEQHTIALRSRVASSVDSYLKDRVRNEMIFAFQPTVCNESNNTIRDVRTGNLNVRVTYTPIFPADFINVDLVRDLTTELSINTQVG